MPSTTTPTTAPATSAEAHRLAAQLEATERDTDKRRRDARKAASIAEARRQLEHADTVLAPARDEAVAALTAAIPNPDVPLADLAGLVQAVRVASAARAAAVRQANSVLSQLQPRRNDIGVELAYRGDIHDSLAHLTVAETIDEALTARANAVANATDASVRAAITTAGDQAADAIG